MFSVYSGFGRQVYGGFRFIQGLVDRFMEVFGLLRVWLTGLILLYKTVNNQAPGYLRNRHYHNTRQSANILEIS